MADSKLFDVILHRIGRLDQKLLVPRTAQEVADLKGVGHNITVTPHVEAAPPSLIPSQPMTPPPPDVFRNAMTALTALFKHAEAMRNDQLQARAGAALSALLHGSGVKLEIKADVKHPPSSTVKVTQPLEVARLEWPEEHTLVGLGRATINGGKRR